MRRARQLSALRRELDLSRNIQALGADMTKSGELGGSSWVEGIVCQTRIGNAGGVGGAEKAYKTRGLIRFELETGSKMANGIVNRLFACKVAVWKLI